MKNRQLFLLAIFLLMMGTSFAQKQKVLKVNADGSEEFTTITEAIAAAKDGDIIDVYGTITGEGEEVLGIVINKNITIQGQGSEETFIQGSVMMGDEKINRRVFTVMPGVTVTIKNLTIRHGFLNASIQPDPGAAIKNMGNLVLRNCQLYSNIIMRNDCMLEGGIYNAGGGMLAIDQYNKSEIAGK